MEVVVIDKVEPANVNGGHTYQTTKVAYDSFPVSLDGHRVPGTLISDSMPAYTCKSVKLQCQERVLE